MEAECDSLVRRGRREKALPENACQAERGLRMEQKRIFYVDNRNGDDINNGLSPEQAWKSLEHLNTEGFLPGDVIRLKKGCEWHGMLAPKGSGSRYAPIVLESYGEGEVSDRPVIHGDGAYAAILLEGVSHWILRDIRVTNQAPERAVRQGICVCGSPLGITENIVIEGCEISHVTGENRRSRSVYESMYWNGGIYVTFPGRSSAENHLQDIVISNNYIHDVLTSGIRINQQEDFLIDIHHTHVVVRGNWIERTGSDGIIVANCISPLISGNTCVDAGALGSLEDTQLIAGVWVCATSNALIERNEVIGTNLFENDGTAFDTDWGTAGNTVFQYNYSSGNQGGFWLDCMGINRNPDCGRTILRYNISVNDKRCLIQDDYKLPGELYGNAFINTEEGPLVCCHQPGMSHRFWNNLFDFAEPPKEGWQQSWFEHNWYGPRTGVCERDAHAVSEIPEILKELLEKAPASRAACDRYWDALALFGCMPVV